MAFTGGINISGVFSSSSFGRKSKPVDRDSGWRDAGNILCKRRREAVSAVGTAIAKSACFATASGAVDFKGFADRAGEGGNTRCSRPLPPAKQVHVSIQCSMQFDVRLGACRQPLPQGQNERENQQARSNEFGDAMPPEIAHRHR